MPPTRQRLAVQEALKDLDHPTADQVFHHVRGQVPRISLATVYRNLDALVAEHKAGVREIGGQRRYDDHAAPHGHLHCTVCDRLVDLRHAPGIEAKLATEAVENGFEYHGALIEVRGVCPACKGSRDRPSKEETP